MKTYYFNLVLVLKKIFESDTQKRGVFISTP